MTKRQNRVWAELKLPTRNADFIVRVAAIIEAADGNPRLAGVDVILVPLRAAFVDLQEAQVEARMLTKGKASARDAKRLIVRGLLEEYKTFVQKIADANLEEASSIIESAGLFTRNASSRRKLPFTVRPGPIPGSVIVAVRAVAKRATYYFEWSADGGLTWNPEGPRQQSEVTITDLPVGKFVLFRWAGLKKDGIGDWSEPIGMLVR